VDLYIGGPEHAVGHLLYSRMWNRYLCEKGYAPTEEPFKKLIHQGMILGANGIKMGKRYPEFAIDPRDVIKEYGADALRLNVMFLGPVSVSKPWNNNGMVAARRFIERIYRLYFEENRIQDNENKNLEVIYNQTVKKVTEDYENLSFNTAIAQIMTFVNAVYKEEVFPKNYAEGLVQMLNPIIPHITEEIWHEVFGYNSSIADSKFPVYDETKLTLNLSTFELPVQVNGKLKVVLNVDKTLNKDGIIETALNNDKVKASLLNKEVVKTIYIPNKLLNIVVK
jgi:leucyl-tRNA synthetase